MIDNDELELLSFSRGDLNLLSEVQLGADGIITNSCTGQLTENVFFGKAGVGKSTISSLVSSKPDLFRSGKQWTRYNDCWGWYRSYLTNDHSMF